MHDLIQAVIDATGQREAASQMRREDMHTRACDRQRAAIEALEHVLAHERELAAGNATLSASNDDLTALLQNKEAAIADLRDELAEARKPNVARGKEAEELRRAIEALLAEEWSTVKDELYEEELRRAIEALLAEEWSTEKDELYEMETVVKHRLQRILDSVDARDAVAHLDAEAALARDRGIPDRAERAELRAAYDAVDRMETERNEWRERKEAADKVIAQTGERLNWSGLETVEAAAQRVSQERETLRRQLASCRASERYLTEAIHQIPDLGEDEDYQVAVRRVLADRDQWRAHAEDRDRGFAMEVRRRQEAEAKLTKVAAKVNRRIAELEAAGEDEGERQASERIIAAMKRRCACEFKDGDPVSECHRHAVERSGRRDNGDPIEWRSRPGQFGGPHEPVPVDMVRAKLVMANARIAAVEAECARVEGRPMVAAEPAATAQLAALAVVDEIRAALREAKP